MSEEELTCEMMFSYERKVHSSQYQLIAGVDEAGRGPLAGPVVAAAVVFPEAWYSEGLPAVFKGLTDSKKLTERQRERLYLALSNHPELKWSVAELDSNQIDQLNILKATHKAMNLALGGLNQKIDHVLIDGLPVPLIEIPQTAIVKGDAKSYSIAAASIFAKVTRDRMMVAYDKEYEGYGFAKHKGYPTKEHLATLERLGPSPIHRLSFSPLKQRELDLFA